jgi:hypothetical protein
MRPLEVELLEERIEVGFVDEEIGASGGEIFDFVERVKEAHFRDGVFFGAAEAAAFALGPFFNGGGAHENGEREIFFAIGGDDINKFGAAREAAARGANFHESVLVYDSGGGGIGLDAVSDFGASHARLFGGIASRVKSSGARAGWRNLLVFSR